MSSIGIDFGTSFCSASWFNKNLNHPEVVTFPETSSQKMPSVIYVSKDGDLVGRMAADQLDSASNLDTEDAKEIFRNTETSIKRKLRKDGKYAGGLPAKTIISRIFSKILSEMDISCSFGDDVPDTAVLTHPVKFTQWMKDILEDAAKEAGLKKVVFLEEPVSAALGYLCHNQLHSEGLMVYDLGAGTFDVAYVEIKNDDKFIVPLECLGDANCGGDDVDRDLYDFLEKEAIRIKGRPVSKNQNVFHIGFLKQCRNLKEFMSVRFASSKASEIKINVVLPKLDSGSAATSLLCNISREDFYNIIDPTIEKTISICKTMISNIKSAGKPLDHILLIGGGSKLPLLKEKLQSLVGDKVTILTSGEAETAVALGASYYLLPDKKLIKPDANPNDNKPEAISISDASSSASSKAKFCMWCGKSLDPNYKFCIYCGKKVRIK